MRRIENKELTYSRFGKDFTLPKIKINTLLDPIVLHFFFFEVYFYFMSGELLVPRRGITFKRLEEGRFIPLSNDVPEILRTPMVRGQGGSILGHESGYRSGLIRIDGQLYKIKACRPEEGERKDLFGNPIPGPKGTHILGLAQFEADNTLERREHFLREGWEYPLKPIGFWAYDYFKYEGQTTGATIFRVKGDTRPDELIWYLGRAPLAFDPDLDEEASSSLFKVGLRIGQALKTFHNGKFAWDYNVAEKRKFLNAHHGNVIIFPDRWGNAESGLGDFDNSIKASEPSNAEQLKLVQAGDLEMFRKNLHSPAVSTPKERHTSPNIEADIIETLFERFHPKLSKHDRYIAARRVMRDLDPGETTDLHGMVKVAVGRGYNGITQDSSVLKWVELASLVKRATDLRQSFRLRVLEHLGENLTKEMILELAKAEV